MRKPAVLALKLIVSAGLLYWAFRDTDLREIGARLTAANPWWLGAAVGLFMVQFAVAARRWQALARRAGSRLGYTGHLRAFLIANFFNQTFVATAGGDAVRIWTTRRAGAGLKGASFAVLADRMIGMSVLLAIIAIGLIWTVPLIADAPGRIALLLIVGGGLAGVLLFFALGAAAARRTMRWRVLQAFAELSRFVRRAISGPGAVLVIGLSVLIHLLTATSVWMIGEAVSAGLSYQHSLLFTPIVFFVALMPVSIAGWGVREGMAVAVYVYAGVTATSALTLAITTGLVLLTTALLGGLVWLVSPAPKTDDDNPKPDQPS